MTATIKMLESDRAFLSGLLHSYIETSALTCAELEHLNVIRAAVDAAAPKPEDAPALKWERSGAIWSYYSECVGTYSVKRNAVGNLYYAYLDNRLLTSVEGSVSLDDVKRAVEFRIARARKIAKGE